MDDEELARLLADLEGLMAELGLDFIVTQERILGAEGVSLEFKGARASGGTGDLYLNQMLTRDGIPRNRPIEEDEDTGTRIPGAPRLKKGDVAVAPLDVRDRLAILLDLIEVATAGTLVMERDLSNQLEEFRRLSLADHGDATVATLAADVAWAQAWDRTVIFVDPPEEELRGRAAPPWTLSSGQALQTQMAHARTVVEILDGFREAAGVARGKWLAPDRTSPGNGDVWDLTRQPS